MSNYILAKSLALYTGSSALLSLISEMKDKNCSSEAFRYIKRTMLECLVIEMDAIDLESDIKLCITQCGSFYEVIINNNYLIM